MKKSLLWLAGTLLICVTAVVAAGCAVVPPANDTAGVPGRTSTTVITGAHTEVGGHRISEGDGWIPRSAPVGSLDVRAAVAILDPELRRALVVATAAAADAGVEVRVNSGWRTTGYQQALLDEAVQERGSLAQARRWVNSPERSSHVRGEAVDIGSWDAMDWMSAHGSDFGLCQTYENEAWHYERATTPGGTCPEMLVDGSAG